MPNSLKSLLPRLALAVLSMALSSLVGLWAYHSLSGGAGPTVTLVDRSEDFLNELGRREMEGRAQSDQSSGHSIYLLEDKAALAEYMRERVPRGMVFDPLMFKRRPSNERRKVKHDDHPDGGWVAMFNDYGLRNERQVLAVRPKLRVLVTGDSHTEGVVSNPETFCAVLEGLLEQGLPAGSAEVLNAGVASHNLYNYVGVAERYLEELKPEVFMVVVYGGNDFAPAAKLHRYFARKGRYKSKPHVRTPYMPALGKQRAMFSQQLSQVLYFMNNPEDEEMVKGISLSISEEIARLCAASGTTPLFVYLPPCTFGQPGLYRDVVADLTQRGELTERDLEVSERIANNWLDELRARGLATLDLREVYSVVDQSLYWDSDKHINIVGNDLAAQAMEESVRERMSW